VWAVRREVAAARAADVAALAEALGRGRSWGAENRDAVIGAALAKHPFDRALYEDYFTRLTYVLDDRALRGLDRFAGLLGHRLVRPADDSKDASRVAR
jgi:predicted solute-binding protein